jgi:hypothetical protein
VKAPDDWLLMVLAAAVALLLLTIIGLVVHG